MAQYTWVIGNNKVNEARFQYARRGLLYNFSSGPGGGDVAINIPGTAFFGREPFSFVRRARDLGRLPPLLLEIADLAGDRLWILDRLQRFHLLAELFLDPDVRPALPVGNGPALVK